MSSINKKNNLKKIGYHILLIIIFTVFLIPIIILIYTSLQGGGISNYIKILSGPRVFSGIVNSIIISVPTVTMVIFISSLTAFPAK